ncbi:MAG: hypothetical protein KGL41_01380 [Actinomycetales bacterium]|nr:hypothetical protein [Actinomycetales bacterium]
MDLTIYLNVAFIAVYGAILGLVAPYVGAASKSYHSTAPGAIAIIFGSLLWAILTWTGLSYEQPWIWLIVMLTMPAAMWFGAKRLESIRA